ncbi:major pollen allergen Ole e 10-like [Durio zibethinus]|uniref:Major pollen allergen Ole e 10-like n=1 Tax=Durio zibethinus TaxID=66656 RepID=A0A6P5WZ53_DURZI|nr:major pollen allergen Ole e 10-like [Durio zibethinus]
MANKPILSLPIFTLFVLFPFLYSGGSLKMANGQKTWCIANPLSSGSVLAANIEYACSQLDCRLIQPNGPCFEPDTQLHHASFVMNLYYQANGRHLAHCDFRNSGLVSLTDPSYGNCTFHSGTWRSSRARTIGNLRQQRVNSLTSLAELGI